MGGYQGLKLKSPMVHMFSNVPQAQIPRSVFNVRQGYKTTFDPDYLIPFYVNEALPGDTFNLQATLFCRLMPLATPIMDNLFLDTFYFAVPLRLVWSNFQKFMGEQTDPDDSTDYTIPQVTAPATTGWAVGSLFDYFGLPTGVDDLSVNALFSRAYNLIWNEWFRDQNLQDSVVVDKDDGPDSSTDYVLLKRGKRHDYFTSCLPWPQKGDAVNLPLGGTAAVTGLGKATGTFPTGAVNNVRETDGDGTTDYASAAIIGGWSSSDYYLYMEQDPSHSGYPNIRVDLSSATASTINALREAFQLQRMLERDARGGSRYIEIVRSHFGVVSPDARLQRPEYLGGNSSPLLITPVAQTAPKPATGTTTPQGYLAGVGTVASIGEGFTKSFTEHCIVMGLCMVRADLTYQQGIPRMFSRETRYDFYWPALSNLGEQEVLNKEIYAQGTAADDEVFGYQERYGEYRYGQSKITGKLRSTYATSLDVWHMAQEFGSLPTLSDTFIKEEMPISRALLVTSEPAFILDCLIDNRMVRPMPIYSVPGMIDHF